jgi:hypothetical protein
MGMREFFRPNWEIEAVRLQKEAEAAEWEKTKKENEKANEERAPQDVVALWQKIKEGRENGIVDFPFGEFRPDYTRWRGFTHPEAIEEAIKGGYYDNARDIAQEQLQKQETFEKYKKGDIPEDLKQLMRDVTEATKTLRGLWIQLRWFTYNCKVDWDEARSAGHEILRRAPQWAAEEKASKQREWSKNAPHALSIADQDEQGRLTLDPQSGLSLSPETSKEDV